MKARIVLIAILALFSITTFAGGYGGNYRLQQAAAELDYAAKAYAKDIQYVSGSRKLNKAARRFARATADFCYLVERGAGFRELYASYERVEARFYRLHEYSSYYPNAHYGHKARIPDLHPVKYAFNDVGGLLNAKAERRVQHHDGYGYGQRKGVVRGRYGNNRRGISFGYRFQ